MPIDLLRPQRRRELAEFLRLRRERIKPLDVGLPHVARRRTPGLRREEVAELAGVGATWYTWLEQARDIQPSEDVLERLARALQLNQAEIEHLFALAGKATPRRLATADEEAVPPSLLRALESYVSTAAVVLGRRWDVLASNSAARSLFVELADDRNEKLNWLYMIFCLQSARDRIVDWESNARRVLAEFRLSVSDSLDSVWAQELIASLKTESPEFRAWWDEHDVRDLASAAIEFREFSAADPSQTKSAVQGVWERVVLYPSDAPSLRVLLYMPPSS